MINFQFFPRSHGGSKSGGLTTLLPESPPLSGRRAGKEIQAVIDCFMKIETTLDDGKHRVSNVTEVERRVSLLAMPRCSNVTECNDVLALLRPYLEACGATTRDYHEVKTFLETLYVSNRLRLPLKGILLIGY